MIARTFGRGAVSSPPPAAPSPVVGEVTDPKLRAKYDDAAGKIAELGQRLADHEAALEHESRLQRLGELPVSAITDRESKIAECRARVRAHEAELAEMRVEQERALRARAAVARRQVEALDAEAEAHTAEIGHLAVALFAVCSHAVRDRAARRQAAAAQVEDAMRRLGEPVTVASDEPEAAEARAFTILHGYLGALSEIAGSERAPIHRYVTSPAPGWAPPLEPLKATLRSLLGLSATTESEIGKLEKTLDEAATREREVGEQIRTWRTGEGPARPGSPAHERLLNLESERIAATDERVRAESDLRVARESAKDAERASFAARAGSAATAAWARMRGAAASPRSKS